MSRPTLQRLTIACVPEDGAQPWRFLRVEGADPAQALEGRTPEEAARLVPLIFNLCGAAHGHAAAQALGLPARADTSAMARESGRDHALAVLQAWPTALGAPPEREALRLLAAPGPEGLRALRRAVLGPQLAEADFARISRADLGAWLCAGETGTARLLCRLHRESDPAQGRAGLAELTAIDLTQALTRELAGDTAPLPTPLPARETGALGRMAGGPLFTTLLATEGPSLFVRLLARLADLLALLDTPQLLSSATTRGLGLSEAARGLLGHGVEVEDNRVRRYRILSPSAWNLAPGGLLERAFATLDPALPQTPMLARLLVSAINPCVPVDLDFTGALHHA